MDCAESLVIPVLALAVARRRAWRLRQISCAPSARKRWCPTSSRWSRVRRSAIPPDYLAASAAASGRSARRRRRRSSRRARPCSAPATSRRALPPAADDAQRRRGRAAARGGRRRRRPDIRQLVDTDADLDRNDMSDSFVDKLLFWRKTRSSARPTSDRSRARRPSASRPAATRPRRRVGARRAGRRRTGAALAGRPGRSDRRQQGSSFVTSSF